MANELTPKLEYLYDSLIEMFINNGGRAFDLGDFSDSYPELGSPTKLIKSVEALAKKGLIHLDKTPRHFSLYIIKPLYVEALVPNKNREYNGNPVGGYEE